MAASPRRTKGSRRGYELRNCKYDYVEEAGEALLLSMATASESDWSGGNRTMPIPASKTTDQAAISLDQSTYLRWSRVHSVPMHRSSAVTEECQELLRHLSQFRAKVAYKIFDGTMAEKRMQYEQERRRKMHEELIPLSKPNASTYKGHVAKHKRVEELMGIGKTIAPWRTPNVA